MSMVLSLSSLPLAALEGSGAWECVDELTLGLREACSEGDSATPEALHLLAELLQYMIAAKGQYVLSKSSLDQERAASLLRHLVSKGIVKSLRENDDEDSSQEQGWMFTPEGKKLVDVGVRAVYCQCVLATRPLASKGVVQV